MSTPLDGTPFFVDTYNVHAQGGYWTPEAALEAWRSGAEFTTTSGQTVSIRDYPFRAAPPETRVVVKLLSGGAVSLMEHEDGSWGVP